jgi:hypothetical protein
MATLVERVQAVILKPTTVWDEIDGEPASVQSLFMNYAAVLAAIPAIAGLIGGILWGLVFHTFGNMMFGALDAVVGAILGYVLGLAATWVLGFVINMLASSFGSQPNEVQAMKVAVYAGTPAWVAGIFTLIPVVGWLIAWAGAIYSLVLIFFGIARIMKPPADKSAVYAIVAIVIDFVLVLIIGAVVSAIQLAVLAMGGTAVVVH